MKNLKIVLIAAIALISFNSCDEDDTNFEILPSESRAAIINLPTSGTSIVLDIANPTGTATTVVWEDAVYNVPTAIDYTLQFAAAGTDFETPFDVLLIGLLQVFLFVTAITLPFDVRDMRFDKQTNLKTYFSLLPMLLEYCLRYQN